MSSYIIKFKNTSNEEGTIIADAGFDYTDNLNSINKAHIKLSGSSETKRSLIEIGSEVHIYRNGTLEFHGLVDMIDFLEGGGISVTASGYEVWLAKENGDYASSPYSSTASATIFGHILGESTKFTAGTINAGTDIDFRIAVTDSLWNAITNLKEKTGQDIGIDYINSEIDILNHKGSSTTVATFNAGIQIANIRVSQNYPIGNDVRVYGMSEGETRIKSEHASHGQDAGSKSTYGTIRKIVRDPSILTVAEANKLADALVAVYSDPVKIYDFEVLNPNQSMVAGDVITLNSKTQGLSNEEVRIVGIEKGFKNNQEYLVLQVTNKEYSKLLKDRNEILAEIEKNARDAQTYDQFTDEYTSQVNTSTTIGGVITVYPFYLDLGGYGIDNVAAIRGECESSFAIHSYGALLLSPAGGYNVLLQGTLDGYSSFRAINFCNPTGAQDLATKCYVDACVGVGGLFSDGTNPYIVPNNSCGICMTGDIVSANSTNCMGCAASPGSWKEIHGLCVMPGVLLDMGTCNRSAGAICFYVGTTTKAVEMGTSCTCLPTIRTKTIHAYSNGSCCVGIAACRFLGGYINNLYACRKLKIPVGANCY